VIGVALTDVGAVRRGARTVTIPDLVIDGTGLVRVRGGNGCGKSTLIELLAGGIAPATGSVRVCGEPATSPAARRLRRVCRTEVALLGHVTLRRHAVLFARAAGLPTLAATDALADEGLADRLDDVVDELSTGEARRAWVRLTTVGRAPVLLLDEPFLGIDAAAAAALRSRVAAWAEGSLVLVVDHEAHAWQSPALELVLAAPARVP
jgi:ABC-type multidrug transport system ATPase subunit